MICLETGDAKDRGAKGREDPALIHNVQKGPPRFLDVVWMWLDPVLVPDLVNGVCLKDFHSNPIRNWNAELVSLCSRCTPAPLPCGSGTTTPTATSRCPPA